MMNLNINFKVNLDYIFDTIKLSTDVPFIRYKDINKNYHYKIFEDAITKGKTQKKIVRNNFKNLDQYQEDYNPIENIPDITEKQLMSWKLNKISLKERKAIKELFNKVDDIQDYSELTLKVNVKELLSISNLDYATINITNNICYLKLLDDEVNFISKKELELVLEKSIKILNKLGKLSNFSYVIPKINLSNQDINLITLDSYSEFNIPIDEKLKLSKIKKNFSQLYPFSYQVAGQPDTIILKYKKINNYENSDSYFKHFCKLRKNSPQKSIKDFENIWTIEAKKVFNLSAKESLKILSGILEIVKPEDIKKSYYTNEVDIIIKKSDTDILEKMDNYSVQIKNCNNFNELSRIYKFINLVFYKSYRVKEEKKKPIVEVEETDVELKPEPKKVFINIKYIKNNN